MVVGRRAGHAAQAVQATHPVHLAEHWMAMLDVGKGERIGHHWSRLHAELFNLGLFDSLLFCTPILKPDLHLSLR